MTSKRIKIYSWRDDNDNLPIIVNLKTAVSIYNPEDNARNIAKLIMTCLPGNTVDMLLMAIETEIKSVLDNPYCSISILKEQYDISNRIRIALNNLMIEKDV